MELLKTYLRGTTLNPHPLFCPNPDCPSSGVQNAGNIRVHDSLRDRWRCTVCRRTFSGKQGTPFHRLKTDAPTMTLVIALISYGCPPQAIVAAFGFDERTVKSWQKRAADHCQSVHQALVTEATIDLKHVQADEMRIRMQRRLVVWMAMALCVPSRLWLGGVTSFNRDRKLIRNLAAKVGSCAAFGALLQAGVPNARSHR